MEYHYLYRQYIVGTPPMQMMSTNYRIEHVVYKLIIAVLIV